MKIFLAVLAVLILILLIPVRVVASTTPEMTAELKYLFFKKRLYPLEKKEKKAKKPKKEKPPKEPKKKKGFPLTVKEIIALLPKAFSKLMPPVKKLLRRTTIAKFRLKMVVVGGDAAETAIKFGKTNAAVVNAVALIDRIFTLRAKQIDIIPGFESLESEFEGSGEVRAIPLAALIAAVSLGINLLILLLPPLMAKKKNKKSEIKENTRKDENDGKEESAQRSA
ncbi:MAG: DUF2953 domain-containing protein [Oscillospiraceae bacterium]|nr:DUF2953 domain-containing protein [Oscillospiraceae bacterium]